MLDLFNNALILFLLVLTGWILWQIARRGNKHDLGGTAHCTECGYDLRASTDRCPECGSPIPILRRPPADHVPLRDDWPADAVNPRTPHPDETPVAVHHARDEAEAQLLASQLNVRGVHSSVQTKPIAGDFTFWQVVVWSGDADYARDLVARLVGTPSSS